MNRATRQALANEESALTRETVLMPYVIADCVIAELYRRLLPDAGANQLESLLNRPLADRLADRAERCYEANRKDSFGRNLRGRNGREWLYAFMRHWLSGELARTTLFSRIPDSFKMGRELEQGGHEDAQNRT